MRHSGIASDRRALSLQVGVVRGTWPRGKEGKGGLHHVNEEWEIKHNGQGESSDLVERRKHWNQGKKEEEEWKNWGKVSWAKD